MDEYDRAFARELIRDLRGALDDLDSNLDTAPRQGTAFNELCRTLAEMIAQLKRAILL